MDALKQSCLTRTTLLTAWQSAADLYFQAVAELSKRIGIVPKPEYDKLTKAAEIARKQALEAQASFEIHTKEHGCDGARGGDKAAA
jgi:hypothetical protein